MAYAIPHWQPKDVTQDVNLQIYTMLNTLANLNGLAIHYQADCLFCPVNNSKFQPE
jgi:hypothetical protein